MVTAAVATMTREHEKEDGGSGGDATVANEPAAARTTRQRQGFNDGDVGKPAGTRRCGGDKEMRRRQGNVTPTRRCDADEGDSPAATQQEPVRWWLRPGQESEKCKFDGFNQD